jgi:hypothetical protein
MVTSIAAVSLIDNLMQGNKKFFCPHQAMAADEEAKNDNKEDGKQILQAVAGAKAIKLALKMPDTFKLESMILNPSGSVCYLYLSENGPGGMSKSAAVLIGAEVKTSEMEGFDLQWEQECNGTKGKDITGYGELMIY